MDEPKKLEETGLRPPTLPEQVAGEVLALFKTSLNYTIGLTAALALVDAIFIAYGKLNPADRLITEKVVMMIIGASIVQVGAALIAIVYALFGRKSQPED